MQVTNDAPNPAIKSPEKNLLPAQLEKYFRTTKTNDAMLGTLDENGLPISGPLADFADTLIEQNKTANGQVGLYIKREEMAKANAKKEVQDKYDRRIPFFGSMFDTNDDLPSSTAVDVSTLGGDDDTIDDDFDEE